MIRRFRKADLEAVMRIWLDANTQAHNFIHPDYWREHFEAVKEMIPRAEVYVSEDSGRINGFVGITQNYIAGIFVDQPARGQGIGTALLNFAKKSRKRLELSVYLKNTPAVRFYEGHGFCVESERVDQQTGEPEYEMVWTGDAEEMK